MRFIQMWIIPARRGLEPSIERRSFSDDPSETVQHRFRPNFHGYLFVVHGAADVSTDGDAGKIDEGGAVKVEDEPEVSVRARNGGAELLLVETRAIDH